MQKGILTVPNVEVAAEQLLDSLSGGLMIRSTLGLPPLLKNDADIEQWVEIAVANFLKPTVDVSNGWRIPTWIH